MCNYSKDDDDKSADTFLMGGPVLRRLKEEAAQLLMLDVLAELASEDSYYLPRQVVRMEKGHPLVSMYSLSLTSRFTAWYRANSSSMAGGKLPLLLSTSSICRSDVSGSVSTTVLFSGTNLRLRCWR